MKKHHLINTFFVTGLLCGFSSNTFAQETSDESTFKVGFKVGANVSNLYTKDVNSENPLIGFNAGIFAKVPIISFFAIQPEIYYTTKGAKNTYNNVFANGSVKYTFNYLEIPVLGVINFAKNFNIQVGPYVGFLVSGKVSNESSFSPFDFERNISTDNYNKIDVGFIGGVGFDFNVLSFSLRYSYGVNKVGKNKNYNGAYYIFPDGKNSVLSLNVAFSVN